MNKQYYFNLAADNLLADTDCPLCGKYALYEVRREIVQYLFRNGERVEDIFWSPTPVKRQFEIQCVECCWSTNDLIED